MHESQRNKETRERELKREERMIKGRKKIKKRGKKKKKEVKIKKVRDGEVMELVELSYLRSSSGGRSTWGIT